MKSRQISGIHFFSVLLKLQWWYVIGAPFLNLQCSNWSKALLDLIYISYSLSCINMENLFGFRFTYLVSFLNCYVPNSST